MDDIVQQGRKKKEWLDPRLAPEVRNEDLQKQGKIPAILVKGVVLALAVALLPLLQKQSNMGSYANHADVGRSWELIKLLVVGLAVSYGLMARRPEKGKDTTDDTEEGDGQGTHNYVHKMFEFAGVFDDFKPDGVRDKVETWSSRWQPEEPLIIIAGDHHKKESGEKPLLLPVRSLKSSLSNPDVLAEFLNDGKVADSKPVQDPKKEVRNGELLTVESGNFEEEVDNVMSEPAAVFPSPIPWASRSDVLSGGKEPRQTAPPAESLASSDGKIEHLNEVRAFPSPIPWHSRPDRTSIDGNQKNSSENPNVSEGKPPLAPPHRPPPPPPPPPRSAGLANGGSHKSVQTPPTTPPQKFSSPRPSPSPPRPRNASLENGSSLKQTNPAPATTTPRNSAQTIAKETPPPPPTENGLRAKSQNNHANGDIPRQRDTKTVPNSDSSDEVKPRKAPIPSPSTPPLSPATSAVFEESPSPRKAPENGVASRSDSRSKTREGSSHRSDSRSKGREGSSHRSDSRSKDREGLSHRSDSRSKSREQHSSREVEIDSSSVLKQSKKDTSDKSSRKFPSPPPPPDFADVPYSTPLPPPPPPPPPPSLPDEPTSDPIAPPPPVPKDEEHTASFSDGLKREGKVSAPPNVVFGVGSSDSESESELELHEGEDQFEDGPDEVDRKADQFIAKFHEQIRLQRQESIRRSRKGKEESS